MNQEARDIMTKKLITVSSETSLLNTINLMSERRIRHMPVVDEFSKIVGIVSQRDLNMSLPAILDTSKAPIKLFMNSPVQYIEQSTPIRKVIFKMLEDKISCVIVGNDQNDAVGIITTDDLLWHLAEMLNTKNENHRSLWDVAHLQTIGELASKLSDVGI